MPRRREVPKRRINPDPKFKDKLITKFNNSLMLSGKKSTAERILYGAFDLVQERYKEEPIDVVRKALDPQPAVRPTACIFSTPDEQHHDIPLRHHKRHHSGFVPGFALCQARCDRRRAGRTG